MSETNISRSGVSRAADLPVSSTFEDEIERGEISRCEVDPNSEEVRLWKATRAERRAAALKAYEERMKGPAIAYEIDQTLYAKAETRNAELTDEERALLQSRGDAVGKALAYPELLTTEETYQVLTWCTPHVTPDIVYNDVRHWTKGAMSDPLELYAKVKDAFQYGTLDDVPDEELALVGSNFGARIIEIPGNREAYRLITGRLGIDVHTLLGITSYIERERPIPGFDPNLCSRLHRYNWGLPELPKQGPEHTSLPQVQRNYSQYDQEMQARGEELSRQNREGMAEIERFMDSHGVPWPEDIPRPSCRPAPATLRSNQASVPRDTVSNANAGNQSQPQRPLHLSKGYFEFRDKRLAALGSDKDSSLRNDPEVEAEIDRLWSTMSKEEREEWDKKRQSRMMERLKRSRAGRD